MSDDGVVHSFGRNKEDQLGLGHNNNVSIPNQFSTLPKISQVSCGSFFTFCLDYDGFVWSFGQNKAGQLGAGNTTPFTTNFNAPQKILEIPLVISVVCGYNHTSIITNNSSLWCCGNNEQGQLFLGNNETQKSILFFQPTSFSHISKISLGFYYSLFQNYEEEIYACGRNAYGELGLGHNQSPQITPTLIPNLPPNIVQFICGYYHSLFLDSEGNVFSVGENQYGQLGLAHNINQNVLNQIQNIPPIKTISCVGHSSYLLDIAGNIWSFGNNTFGQLEQGDTHVNSPTKIESLKNIQQISYGSGAHILAKVLKIQYFY